MDRGYFNLPRLLAEQVMHENGARRGTSRHLVPVSRPFITEEQWFSLLSDLFCYLMSHLHNICRLASFCKTMVWIWIEFYRHFFTSLLYDIRKT